MLSRLSCPNRVNNHELNTIGARIDRIKLSINKFVVSLKPRMRVIILKINYGNYIKKKIEDKNFEHSYSAYTWKYQSMPFI